jgi:hypothetical protein
MYIPQQHTNARTQELTAALRAAIASAQVKHPKLTQDEIRSALQAVTPATKDTRVKVAAMVATGVLFLGAFGALVAILESPKAGRPVPWILITTLLIPFTALVVALWLRSSDD